MFTIRGQFVKKQYLLKKHLGELCIVFNVVGLYNQTVKKDKKRMKCLRGKDGPVNVHRKKQESAKCL